MPFALVQELDSSSFAVEHRPVDLSDLALPLHQQLAKADLFPLVQAFLVRPYQRLAGLAVVAA